MSHELKECDRQEGREMAWHKMTQLNPELSIDNCHLNPKNVNGWDYLAKPVQTVAGEKLPLCVLGVTDNAMMNVLDEAGEDTGERSPLIIGRAYNPRTFKPVFNVRLLELLAKAIDGQGLTLESCGTVFNRGRVFLSFALAAAKFQAAGREFKAFLNVGNGNDMSSPLWVNTSNICTVCNNTFTANLSDAGMIMSVKKTQFSDFALADMGKAIGAMFKGQKEFAKTLGTLSQIDCDEKTAREFFAGFTAPNTDGPMSTRAENTVERLVQLFKGGAGNDGNDYSDVFQAVTDYYTHEAASGKGDDGANWKNFVSSEFGAGKRAKMDGFAALTDDKLRKAFIQAGRKVLKLTADEARKAD